MEAYKGRLRPCPVYLPSLVFSLPGVQGGFVATNHGDSGIFFLSLAALGYGSSSQGDAQSSLATLSFHQPSITVRQLAIR